MFSLFGCTKKYHVNYLCNKDILIGSKDYYRVGQTVKLKMMIGTDTDYTFSISDNVKFDKKYQDGYMIYTFAMPNHDIDISVSSYNSMANVRQVVAEYRFQTKATPQNDYRYYTLIEHNDEYILECYENNYCDTYNCGPEILANLKAIIETHKLTDWGNINELCFIDGASYSFFYYDDNTEVSISSDHMPEEGTSVFLEIENIFKTYCK